MDSFEFPPEAELLDEKLPFGHSMRRHYLYAENCANVNHGSYGRPLKIVTEAFNHYQQEMNMHPDGWFRYDIPVQLARVRQDVADFVDADLQAGQVVLVHNATFAINSILRGWRWKPGDKLLLLSEAYVTVKCVAEYLRDEHSVELILVPVKFPMTDDAMVQLVDEAITNAGGVTLAVFSHMSAIPAVLLPVGSLIDLCRRRNVVSAIDGAHIPGQIPLSLRRLRPDFYFGNGHKWLSACRGAAFLYFRHELADRFRSALISVGCDSGTDREFMKPGTDDYSAWLTLSTAIALQNRLGQQRIFDYCHPLAVAAGKLLADVWSTEVLVSNPDQLGAMNNVLLPLDDVHPNDQRQFVQKLVRELYFSAETFLVTFEHHGRWYCRISAYIYNEIDDFQRLADAFLAVRRRLTTKEPNASG